MEQKRLICAECLLEGEHKNHKFIRFDHILQNLSKIAKQKLDEPAQVQQLKEKIRC